MALPPILVELKASSSDFMAKMGAARAEMQHLGTDSSAHMQKFAAVGKAALLGTAVAAVGVGIASVKMAADFQQSMTQLVTGAGESQSQIKMVGNGILDLSTKVGYSAQQLAKGMYLIESAGFHGANGLNVLKAAAEGARAGNAEMATVADALTTAMNAYHEPASKAIAITNQLIKTEQSGKLTMEQLAGSLGSVVPAAATAHISLSEVLGAIATMTNQGTDAANATTYLRQTILQLSNPTAKARTEMTALGLSSIDISSNLGKRGLTGTLEILTNAIEKKMGPAGIVLIDQLQKSAKHTSTFQKVLANLPPVQQTMVAALANMVGGTKSMQAALELTGASAKNFKANVEGISGAAKGAGKDVTDWKLVQQNFNLQLANLENTLGKLAIQIGDVLIPVLEKAAGWLVKHQEIVKILAIGIGTVLVVAIAAYGVAMAAAAVETIAATWPILAIIAAVAAVGVGIYELATHWRTIWNGIKDVAAAAWHFLDGDVIQPIGNAFVWLWRHIKSAGDDIIHILETWGPVALAVLVPFIGIPILIAQHFGQIKEFLGNAFGAAKKAVETAVGDLMAFTKSIPGRIVSALGDLSSLLYNAGADVIHGFVHGIESAAGSVKDTLESITHKLTSWKGPPAKDRRILFPAGQLVIQGFVDGIESMTAKVRATLGKFTVHAHDIMFTGGKSVAEALIKGLESVDAKLKTKFDNIVSQIASVQAAANQMRDSIASSLSGAASLSSQPSQVDANGQQTGPDTSVGGVTSYLQSSLAALQQFQTDLATLSQKGLSADEIQQIAQMGVTKGDEYAQSFLGASADQIAQLNNLDSQIQKVSTGIGTLVSNDTFGTQLTALTAQEKETAKSMKGVEKMIAELLAEAKKKKGPVDFRIHIDGNMYGVSAKEFAKEIRLALLEYRRTSGQSLGFT